MVALGEREQEELETAWTRLEEAAVESARRSRERREQRGLRGLVRALRPRRPLRR